ncbi:MAG: hypothetical protein NVS2B3_15300 [Vulcanimicrobiaceae bacterium]
MLVIGSVLSALVALSFLGLGAGAAVAPGALAENYGLPSDDPTAHAYVRGLGARDAVLGLLVLRFLIAKARGPLSATVAFSALVGASDFAIVYAARGRVAKRNLAIHGGGTVGLLAVSGLVRAGL